MELSIIIPTFNRAALLKKTLQSILDQQADGRLFEVIVIDNGSTDQTREICQAAGKDFKHFIYHYDAEPGQLTGRHKGTEMSSSQLLSFIDDDVELNKNWVRSVINIFTAQPGVSIIGGPCLPKYESDPPQWIDFFWEATPNGGRMCLPLSLIDIPGEQLDIDPLYIFGLNYSIRRKSLIQLGGFHPDCIPATLQRFQGDGETGLSLKARLQHVSAVFAASASLHHQVRNERMTPAYFENWYFYNGVCHSFTNIRNKHHLYGPRENYGALSASLRKFSGRLQQKLNRLLKKPDAHLPEEIKTLKAAFGRRYQEGYLFHQSAFEKDQEVKEWVLKKDYWEYKLP